MPLALVNGGIQSVSDQLAAPKRREKHDSNTGLLWALLIRCPALVIWTEALRIFAIHEYIVVLIKFEYFAGTTGVLSNFFKHEMSKK
jgi:hypothetical protein